jgi:hypothetical protein
MMSGDISLATDADASPEDRVAAVRRLGQSDDRSAWDALVMLATDHSMDKVLAEEAGTALGHMANRLREPGGGAILWGQDENFLLRDFSETAYLAYDATTGSVPPPN